MKTYTTKQLEKMDANELRLLVLKIQEAHEANIQNVVNQNRKQLDMYYNNQRLESMSCTLPQARALLSRIDNQMGSWASELEGFGFKLKAQPDYY